MLSVVIVSVSNTRPSQQHFLNVKAFVPNVNSGGCQPNTRRRRARLARLQSYAIHPHLQVCARNAVGGTALAALDEGDGTTAENRRSTVAADYGPPPKVYVATLEGYTPRNVYLNYVSRF